MDEGRAKKAQLARVMSEQVVGASAGGRKSPDSSKHRSSSHKSGKGSREDDKSTKKSQHHRLSNGDSESSSPVNGIRRQGSQDNIERRSSSSSPKAIRHSASVKDMSLSGRESPARAIVRGYEFSMTDDQKNFIKETIPRLRENDPSITTVITNKNLPAESFLDFASAMEVNKKVNTLDMSDSLYSVPISVHVAKILHENRTIRELNANGNTLRTEGIKKIALELGINNTLTRLFLRNNLIDDEGAISIFENLQENTALQILDLGKNNLSHQCLPALIRAMKTNRTLQELMFDGTNMGDEGMVQLAEAFSPAHNTSLKVLSLQDAQIGAKGFSAFASAMQAHQSLNKLLLRGNKIKVDRTAAENLFKLATLQELDLSANLLCEEGVVMLAQGLMNNSSLLQLNLSETLPTTITMEPINAMKCLAQSLSKNRSLQTLMLVKNGLQDESVEALMTALEPGKSALQVIDLSCNRITNKGAEHIARMLNTNTQLREMNLSANKIMLVGAKFIIDALKQNRTLLKFIFINTSVESSLPQAALEMLKQNVVVQKCVLQNSGEKKIASKVKNAIRVESKYNRKMNFYSYNVEYAQLLQKLSVLHEIEANDYVEYQKYVAEFFYQTRKIMKFLKSDRASANYNKQQVVKNIVQANLVTIYKLLNETPGIFTFYTDVTDKMQSTYDKLIRDVPTITPAKPLIFPEPPVPALTTIDAAADVSDIQPSSQLIQPPANLDKQVEHAVAIPSQIQSAVAVPHPIDAAHLSAIVSPRVTSTSFQLLSNMDSKMPVDLLPPVKAAIQNSNDAPPAELPLSVPAKPNDGVLLVTPVEESADTPLNNHETNSRKLDGDNDSSNDSTSSLSSNASESSISTFDDRSGSGSRLGSSTSTIHKFQRPDPKVVPPLILPDSDEKDGVHTQQSKTELKVKNVSPALLAAASGGQQSPRSVVNIQVATSAFFKPAEAADKKNDRITINRGSEELAPEQLVEAVMEKFFAVLMSEIICANATMDRAVLEKIMEKFLHQLFHTPKAQKIRVQDVRAIIPMNCNLVITDDQLQIFANSHEVVNSRRFSELSPHSKEMLSKIFENKKIITILEQEEQQAQTKIPLFITLHKVCFEQAANLFSHYKYTNSKNQPPMLLPQLQKIENALPPAPPTKTEWCVIS